MIVCGFIKPRLSGGAMLDFMKKPAFLIILALALIAGGVWYYYSNKAQTTTSTSSSTDQTTTTTPETKLSDLTTATPASYDDSVKNQLSIADSKLAEVDKKGQLAAVDISLPGTLDIGSGNSIFVYNLSADKVNCWMISISNSSGKFLRAKVPKEDYLGELKAIDRNFWKINYVSALQIAEKNGGLDFRNANTVSEVKITLKNADPKGWLYWFVDYNTKDSNKEVQIDANTGAVIAQ